MAVYAWRGINAKGKEVKGVDDSDSPKALRAALRKDGVLVTSVEEEAEAKAKAARDVDFGRYFRRVTTVDIAMGTRQLATLLKAGVPLVEALDALIEQEEKPDLQSALTNVRNKVNEGISLADAMREHPKLYEDIYVNMVEAGEASGNLDVVLVRLADVLDAQNRLKGKIGAATIYPLIMMGLTTLVVSFMMIVVVPKMAAVFDGFGQMLPWYTRMLMFVSTMFTDYWYLMAAAIAGAIYGFRRWRNTEKGRASWDLFTLRIPLFGTLLGKVAIARFARTLSTLLSSGVPVLAALDITRNVLGNVELMRVVEQARDSIREGESISKPLAQSGRFPPVVTHMIAVGERSGQLEEMLEHVANAYDEQVDVTVQKLTAALEPLMILVMGGIVMVITLAIMMPMIQMNEFVG